MAETSLVTPEVIWAVVALCLGLYVLWRNPRNIAHRLFCSFMGTTTLFIILVMQFKLSENPRTAIYWGLAMIATLPIHTAIFNHFSLVFPKKKAILQNKRNLWKLQYAIGAILSGWALGGFFTLSESLIASATRQSDFWFFPNLLTTDVLLWAAAYLTFVLYGPYNLIHSRFKEASTDGRKKIDYILLGVGAGMVVGWISGYPILTSGSSIIMVGPTLLAFAGPVAYAIVRHKLFVAPVSEDIQPTKPKYDMERGLCFLVHEDKPSLSFQAFADAVTHGAQGLVLTRVPPARIRSQYGLQKTPIVWIGEQTPSPDIQAATNAEEIAYLIAKFLKEAKDGIVVLDSLEYVAQTAEFRRALKLIYHLKEIVVKNNARLIVSVNPDILQRHELAALEKELETLAEDGKKKAK